MFEIVEKYSLGPGIVYLSVRAPLIAGKAKAGQFVMVRVHEKGERIPLTISDFDKVNATIAIVFQEAGKTTRALSAMRQGEHIPDILGPQGNPSETGPFGSVAVVGGGIGAAPAYLLAKTLKEKKNTVTSLLGFKAKDYVFWEDKLRGVSDRLEVTTDDGSYGKRGLVTALLAEFLAQNQKIDRVFAIGPTVMMKAVAELTRSAKIKTIVSLNSLMVCGMGMCGACRVTVGEETRFTCMDGPDFDGHLVDFDELMKRLETYNHEERA